MQITGFTDNPKAVNLQNNILVDMLEHSQKDEVQIDWFYDADTNLFSAEGEVAYPVPEEKKEELTEQEQAILETAVNTEYLVCLAELGI